MPRQCLSSRWLGSVSLSSWFINLAFILLSLHCASSFSFNWWWATKPTRLKKFRIYTVVVSSKPMDSSLVKESHQTSSSYLLTLHATRLMFLLTSCNVSLSKIFMSWRINCCNSKAQYDVISKIFSRHTIFRNYWRNSGPALVSGVSGRHVGNHHCNVSMVSDNTPNLTQRCS